VKFGPLTTQWLAIMMYPELSVLPCNELDKVVVLALVLRVQHGADIILWVYLFSAFPEDSLAFLFLTVFKHNLDPDV